MKDKLCFRKYRNHGILHAVLLVATVCLCLLLGNIVGLFMMVLCLLFFGFTAVGYLYSYFSYQKKAQRIMPLVGTITNWQLSGRRSLWGCVIVKDQEKEYRSPDYFGSDEAQEMVGKQVSYIILDDTLLIYEILE